VSAALWAIFAALALAVAVSVYDAAQIDHRTTCVNDYNGNGNVTGWHCTESR
jgi:hypothetical protein